VFGLCANPLRRLGEDPERQGWLKTPERVEKSLRWLTRGYSL
jgi:GTP cyclohydrolase IA